MKAFFGKEPNKEREPGRSRRGRRGHPGREVLTGEQKDVLLLDVTPLSLRNRNARRRAPPCSSRATPQFRPRSRRPSPRRTTTRRPWKSTCSRASAISRSTTRRSENSSSPEFRPHCAACRRSRSPSTLTPNGISPRVAAKDKATAKERKIRIEASSGLSDAEVDRHGEGRRRRTRPRTSGSARRSTPRIAWTRSRTKSRRSRRSGRTRSRPNSRRVSMRRSSARTRRTRATT